MVAAGEFPAVGQDFIDVQASIVGGLALGRKRLGIPVRRTAPKGQAEKNNQEK
jgi:hypothetical protein